MPFEVMVVSIVAMCLGYSLLKHILGPRQTKVKKTKNAKLPWDQESYADYEAKADELLRRLKNLEEIIASEPRSTRS